MKLSRLLALAGTNDRVSNDEVIELAQLSWTWNDLLNTEMMDIRLTEEVKDDLE